MDNSRRMESQKLNSMKALEMNSNTINTSAWIV